MPSRAKLIEPHFTSFNTLNAQNNQSTVFPKKTQFLVYPRNNVYFEKRAELVGFVFLVLFSICTTKKF